MTVEADEVVEVLDIYDKMGWVLIKKSSGETCNVPPKFIQKVSAQPDLLQDF